MEFSAVLRGAVARGELRRGNAELLSAPSSAQDSRRGGAPGCVKELKKPDFWPILSDSELDFLVRFVREVCGPVRRAKSYRKVLVV